MFGVTNPTTLSVIEALIKQLEFNYMVVGSSQSLLFELGNAYRVKMELIKNLQNGNIYKTTSFSKKNYPSKLNQKAVTDKNGGANGPRSQNMDMPNMRKPNFRPELVPPVAQPR